MVDLPGKIPSTNGWWLGVPPWLWKPPYLHGIDGEASEASAVTVVVVGSITGHSASIRRIVVAATNPSLLHDGGGKDDDKSSQMRGPWCWNIYIHWGHILGVFMNVGKYSSTMGHASGHDKATVILGIPMGYSLYLNIYFFRNEAHIYPYFQLQDWDQDSGQRVPWKLRGKGDPHRTRVIAFSITDGVGVKFGVRHLKSIGSIGSIRSEFSRSNRYSCVSENTFLWGLWSGQTRSLK